MKLRTLHWEAKMLIARFRLYLVIIWIKGNLHGWKKKKKASFLC